MILFLDFDGVLHPFSRPNGPLSHLPYFEKVMRDFPDVDIVISSAWREGHSLEQLQQFFSEDIAACIVDVTPQLDAMDHPFIREAEIRAWLRSARRERESWVAIDDIASFFSPECESLVLVDGDAGFNKSTEDELRMRFRQSPGDFPGG
jgi:hypothetical protein